MDARFFAAAIDGLTAAPHWYVGFSGGIDSTVLLHGLVSWRKWDASLPPITAIHVNHGLQGPADDWQAHCQRQCDRWSVPLLVRDAGLAGTDAGEAAARTARYAVFREILQADELLWLGHHLDDQVETFFLRLLRGAGPEGLAGIPARRAIGRATLVRPLLHLSRTELVQYAAANELEFVEDPSNVDTAIDRNFLRQEVLPLIAQRWPGYRDTVSRSAQLMAMTTDMLRDSLGVPLTVHNNMNDPGLELAPLLDSGTDVGSVRLRAWLRSVALQPPDRSALVEFLRQLQDAGPDTSPMLECSAYSLRRYREAVYAIPRRAPPDEHSLRPGKELHIPGVGRLELVATAGPGLRLDAGQSLTVSWRRGGERLRPRGAAHSTSLKQLLQERAVPPWWRDFVPLLYLEGELLAVGDLASCESRHWREQGAGKDPLWRLEWSRPPGVPYG